MILYLKNISIEGPETLGKFFQDKEFDSRIIELGQGDALPDDLAGIEAVVCLGGPMNVDEEETYPFLNQEVEFIQKIVRKEIPFLGLCLGSQLLAKSCGAQVGKSPAKEVGFSSVHLTPEGMGDPLFSGFDADFLVYQWHEDMFQVPEEATLLAFSPNCPHQAFRSGSCAYGLQFHVEVTDRNIREWAQAYLPQNDPVSSRKLKEMEQDYQNQQISFTRTAEKLYNNFLKIIQLSKREKVCVTNRHRTD